MSSKLPAAGDKSRRHFPQQIPVYSNNEKVAPINVAEEMSRSFLDYSMSVIISRALPDARDGLKPSQTENSLRDARSLAVSQQAAP